MVVGITARLLAQPASPADAAPTPAESLVLRLQERHRSVADLTARFVQTYRSGALGREVVERGTLAIKPPGRMRWDYEEPEKKTFVSDGKTAYFYVPADRQVIVRDQAGEHGLAITLLSGGANILDRFEAGMEIGPTGQPRLRLTPRTPDPDVDKVYVEVDEASRVKSLDIVDTQGNRSRFRFEGIRENVGLSDKLFHFDIPNGVEVIAG